LFSTPMSLVSSSSAHNYLSQQALANILDRAAPIAGEQQF